MFPLCFTSRSSRSLCRRLVKSASKLFQVFASAINLSMMALLLGSSCAVAGSDSKVRENRSIGNDRIGSVGFSCWSAWRQRSCHRRNFRSADRDQALFRLAGAAFDRFFESFPFPFNIVPRHFGEPQRQAHVCNRLLVYGTSNSKP